MENITQVLCNAMEAGKPVKLVFAGKRKKSLEYRKVTLRPVTIKGEYLYQAEYHYDNKATHENIPFYQGIDFALALIRDSFKQVNILTETEDIQILAAKPENPRITRSKVARKLDGTEHDRQKRYLLPDGRPCDFLIKLGVMSADGKVLKKHYAKFRQINHFLEIAEDAIQRFSGMPMERPLRIIDFGCGKSYLTFALYYYLHILKEREVEIIGLDLKEDVIRFCNETAQALGYQHLKFLTGDIADYQNDRADMVVTLHACDTATDLALINAVRWNSRVILSVPCCQHELFSQIESPVNQPMLKHGIIRDKFTELLTDALRGLKLEAAGYEVSMLEFTSLEHTAKNIMIKAILPDNPIAADMQKASKEYEALKEFYGVRPAIDGLPT